MAKPVTTDDLLEVIIDLRDVMVQNFEGIQRKLLEHDRRFDDHDRRFEAIDRKLLEHDRRFDVMDRRFGRLETRIEDIEQKLAS